MTVPTYWIVSLLSLLITGCTFSTQTRAVETPTVSAQTIAVMPTHSPELVLTPFSDHTGWHIRVQQPATAIVAHQATQLWETQRASFSPFSLLIGLIQCQWGAAVSALSNDTIGHDAKRYGCERLMMHEPVPGTLRYPKTTTMNTTTEAISIPIIGHTLALSHPAHDAPFLTRLIGPGGTLHLTRAEIEAAWRPHDATLQTVQLKLKNGAHTIATAPLHLPDPVEALADDAPMARHLPHPFCVMIQSPDSALRHRLEQWALQENWCVVAGKKETVVLREELAWQSSGRVHDASATPIGTWTTPTVILDAKWKHQEAARRVAFTLTTIESGIVLANVWLEHEGENTALLPVEAWAHLRWRVKRLREEHAGP